MLSHEDGYLDLDCGIARARIAGWLDDELRLAREDGQWVYGTGAESCRITLEALENRAFRNVSIERTHLIAKGGTDAVKSFDRLFTLRFISAGG